MQNNQRKQLRKEPEEDEEDQQEKTEESKEELPNEPIMSDPLKEHPSGNSRKLPPNSITYSQR
jgi:hypothetical protein